MGQRPSANAANGPPCSQYLELQAYEVLEQKLQEFEKAQFKEDLEATKKEIKELKKPIMCLLASLNSSRSEVPRCTRICSLRPRR